MESKEELPVFTQTNLGTRVAVAVSPEITARKFKGELERAHIGCFPELGSLSIDAVMVKRNSYYYHLPDLLPLKHVFRGFQGSWFLHVNASRLKILRDFSTSARVIRELAEIKSNRQNQGSNAVLQGAALVSTAYPLRKKKKRKKKPKVKKFPERCNHERLDLEPKGNISSEFERKRSDQQEVLHLNKALDTNAIDESSHRSLAETVSVSGIIDRYFTDFIDLDNNRNSSSPVVVTRTGQCDTERISIDMKSNKKRNSVKTCKRLLPSLLPEDPKSAGLESNYGRSEVGKRLVVASNNIGSSQRSSMSTGKKFFNSDAWPITRNLVFEMNSND